MHSITPETMHDFFDELVTDLHANGIFATYDEPKGETKDEPYPFHKITHETNHAKNTRGLSAHLGDQPYHVGVGNRAVELQPHQKEITLKTRAIQDALKHYVAPERFAAYVRYFSENLNLQDHQSAVDNALRNMRRQVLPRDTFDSRFTPEEVQTYIDAQTTNTRLQKLDTSLEAFKTGNDSSHYRMLRSIDFMAQSDEITQLSEHPELMFTLAVFQAAHITYREQLIEAIRRAYTPQAEESLLSEDEYENAISVAHFSLRIMPEFFIFGTLAPLVVHEFNKLQEQDPTDKHEQMAQAIANGWQAFFKAGMLKTDIFSTEGFDSEKYEEGRVTVLCPAKSHFRSTQQTGLLEALYEAVIQHQDALEPWITKTQKKTAEALERDNSLQQGLLPAEPPPLPRYFPYQIHMDDLGLDERGYPYLEKGADPNYITKEEARSLLEPLRNLANATGVPSESLDAAKQTLKKQMSAHTALLQYSDRLHDYTTAPIIKQEIGVIYCGEQTPGQEVSHFHWASITKALNEALEYAPEHTETILNAMPKHTQRRIKGFEESRFADNYKPAASHAERAVTGKQNGCSFER